MLGDHYLLYRGKYLGIKKPASRGLLNTYWIARIKIQAI